MHSTPHISKSIKLPQTVKVKFTLKDWLKRPIELGAELINGNLIYTTLPDINHGRIALKLMNQVFDEYDEKPSFDDPPSGWWFSTEVDIIFGQNGLRPDICGWRRDIHAEKPVPKKGAIVDIPQWVGEVVSTSTMGRDWGEKQKIYHESKVLHYWVIDPINKMLFVHRWSKPGYVLISSATEQQIIEAEPFEKVSLNMKRLFR